MADDKEKKEVPKPFWTTDKVTLFAPKGAKHYKPGQEIQIHPRQKDKFIGFGFAETKDEALENDAHEAIAVTKVAPKKAAAVKAVVESDPNKDTK